MTVARRQLPEREEFVEEIGGIGIAHHRVPAWLMVVIVGVIVWGLYYLIKFSVTETSTFQAPAGLIARSLPW